jgi:V/A-type H+-transporting ATPase subunit F
MHKIGVIGDKDSVLFFKAAGLDVYPVIESDIEENRKIVDKLARENYGIIFITEQVAEKISETIDRYNNAATPGIILIPSNAGSKGIGLARVRDNVERAVGMNILD